MNLHLFCVFLLLVSLFSTLLLNFSKLPTVARYLAQAGSLYQGEKKFLPIHVLTLPKNARGPQNMNNILPSQIWVNPVLSSRGRLSLWVFTSETKFQIVSSKLSDLTEQK